jgi:hypothetical protein
VDLPHRAGPVRAERHPLGPLGTARLHRAAPVPGPLHAHLDEPARGRRRRARPRGALRDGIVAQIKGADDDAKTKKLRRISILQVACGVVAIAAGIASALVWSGVFAD